MKAGRFGIRRVGALEIHMGDGVAHYDTGWHMHADWQFVLMTRGRRHFLWPGGGAEIGPGTLLMLPPHQLHRAAGTRAASFLMLYGAAELLPGTAPHPATMSAPADLYPLVRDLLHTPSAETEQRLILHLRALVPEGESPLPAPVEAACRWLIVHKARALGELGAALGYSRFHLIHMFRKALGMAPRSWRAQLRLAEARRRLARGESVSAVAAELGFSDQSHLTRGFRRAFALTPARYRRLCAGREA